MLGGNFSFQKFYPNCSDLLNSMSVLWSFFERGNSETNFNFNLIGKQEPKSTDAVRHF